MTFTVLSKLLDIILHQEQQAVLHPIGSAHSTPPDTRDSTPLSALTSYFPIGSSSTHASTHASTQPLFKAKIIAAFGIPVELTNYRDLDSGFAWKKYKACLVAITACNTLWEDNRLRDVFDRKPTQADIISVFKGKTQ